MRRFSPRFAALALAAALAAPAAGAPREFAVAVAAAERGDFAACRTEFERVAAAAAQDGLARRALYGGAVCAAQGWEIDAALSLLEQAVARGFHDSERFYYDPRLQGVRADRRFPELERKFVEAREAWQAKQNAELQQLVEADQADRRPGAGGIDWVAVQPRDRARVARVHEIVAAGGAVTPDDKHAAALVLQHGEAVADYELAHRLALEAAEADADLAGARWLAAAALDRALVQSGRPQKYGTQFVRRDGRWILAEVEPATTDEERALWEVPPLAESRRRVEAMNAASAPESPAAPPPSAPTSDAPPI